jgi:hypothetical protein
MTTFAAPKVFISYTHESLEHDDQVIALADRLRADGIDAQIDQYEFAPPEGWTRWMRNKIKGADFVLAICSESYQRRTEGTEEPGKGRGGNREGLIIDEEIYESDGRNERFIAVILRDSDRRFIPEFLRTYQNESTETENGYDKLYRRLTHQPEVVKPALGRLRSLPPRERRTSSHDTGSIARDQPEGREPTVKPDVPLIGVSSKKWSRAWWVTSILPLIFLGFLASRLSRRSGEAFNPPPSQRQTGSQPESGADGQPPADKTHGSHKTPVQDQGAQEQPAHPRLRILHPNVPPKTNLVFNTKEQIFPLKNGGTATLSPNGQIRSVHQNGIQIERNLHGGRTIVSEHDGVRIVATGKSGGYVQSAYVTRAEGSYYSRTYFRNGTYRTEVYRAYSYRGRRYYGYVPGSHFDEAFYSWASSPWTAPVFYKWDWSGQPWYGYYGPYLAPYPVYPAGTFWLTDYLIAANLQSAYAQRAAAVADGDDDNDAAQSDDDSSRQAKLSPEVKQIIVDEVKGQIVLEVNSGQGSSDQPLESTSAEVPPALDPKRRIFIVSSDLTVLEDGKECGLTAGDVLTRLTDVPDQNQQVNVKVVSSKKSSCPSGKQVAVSVDALEEMYNHFRENIDEGLKVLAIKQGTNGLPKGPDAKAEPGNLPLPPPDPAALKLLEEQQATADRIEAEVKQEAAAAMQSHKDKR